MKNGSDVDEEVKLDLIDTSHVKSTHHMFYKTNATPSNLKNFYTGNVEDMSFMFSGHSLFGSSIINILYVRNQEDKISY